MRVRHLNCGTMQFPGAPLVCHVLLVETANGLVLVDTGYGLLDIANPGHRLGPARAFVRPVLDPSEAAVNQVARLGYSPQDVRHILLTHLDMDHAGGLADFPHAQVHVSAGELASALAGRTLGEKLRYRTAQFAHGPRFIAHEPTGEPWLGFPAAQQLADIDPRIVMIPLPGHTRGHVAYAVQTDGRWLFHAGDSFYDRSVVDGRGRQPLTLTLQERMIAFDSRRVRDNHRRLAELAHHPDVDVFSAHDPTLFHRLARKALLCPN
ncbi:MBL fold metallo-hydrolase [Actinocrispum sp. NPDC049592]|uniref:MBL fold metallo-hydrolase n=1 Tax=Actinocrispum sp. NPDC049592 TaxID=3154835 RepID=UPI003449D541